MKRSPELRGLSVDHHHALVLARRAVETGRRGSALEIDALWTEVEVKFSTELEPHFAIEEKFIEPALRARGHSDLADRLMEDHSALRSFKDPGTRGSDDALIRFGEILAAHIRFEERELFAVAEEVMSAEELAKVEMACRRSGDQVPEV